MRGRADQSLVSPCIVRDQRTAIVALRPEVILMLVAANGWWLWTILAIVIWIAIAFWPARVASRKGHSFLGYFIFSLIFFPLALIVAYVVSDKTAAAPG
jgi:hypothetical protein